MKHSPLILASASPRRRQLLDALGVAFDVRVCELPEPTDRPSHVSPASWAEALAHFKAKAAAEQIAYGWVLGADTVVACQGTMLGKPKDINDARRMLELQAGNCCEVITGLSLLDASDPETRTITHDITRVWMKNDQNAIDSYLKTGDWEGKAGAYGIQSLGDRLIERIEGSFSNVVGLPVELVAKLLTPLGFLPPKSCV